MGVERMGGGPRRKPKQIKQKQNKIKKDASRQSVKFSCWRLLKTFLCRVLQDLLQIHTSSDVN